MEKLDLYPMRYVAAFAVFLILASSAVRSTSPRSGDNSSPMLDSNALSPTPIPRSTASPIASPVYVRAVQGFAKQYGLDALEQSQLDAGDCEVRVWVGFGSFHPRGLIVSNRSGLRSVIYISGRPVPGTEELEVQRGSSERNTTAASRFDCSSVTRLIREDFPPDKGPRYGDPDETSIVVEARSGADYKLIRYRTGTTSSRGKEILDYAKRLEDVYDVKLVISD